MCASWRPAAASRSAVALTCGQGRGSGQTCPARRPVALAPRHLSSFFPKVQVRKSYKLKSLTKMEAFVDSPGTQVGA